MTDEKLAMYNRIVGNNNKNSAINGMTDEKIAMYNRIVNSNNNTMSSSNNTTALNFANSNYQKIKNIFTSAAKNKKKVSILDVAKQSLKGSLGVAGGIAGSVDAIGKLTNKEDETNYIKNQFKSGIASGVSGLGLAGTTELQNNLQKGENKNFLQNAGDLATSYLAAPLKTMATPFKAAKKAGEIITSDKGLLDKAISLGIEIPNQAINSLPGMNQFHKTAQFAGGILPQADDYVQNVSEKISAPSKNMQQELQKESSNYSPKVNMLGNAVNSIGNMLPSVAVSAYDPALGLATMGVSVKGNATQEALEKGADFDTAVKVGNTKAMTEIGTELLTGGVKLFGKGALDDIVEKGIMNKVTNKVGQFLLKQGYDFAGEEAEEVISDIVGTLVDKGTVNPNATYSVSDLGETATTTLLTTAILKSLGVPINQLNNTIYTNQVDKKSNANNISQQQSTQAINKNALNSILEGQISNRVAQSLNSSSSNIENDINKYYNNMEIGEVQNIPVDEIVKFQKRMGFRTQEQINSLKDYIKNNGLENNPIELVRKNDGTIEIEDGNHRLLIAQELGMKEVPVKFVESWKNIGLPNKAISNELSNEIGGLYDDNTAKGNSIIDETNRNKQGSLYNNNEQYQNSRTTEENANISSTKSYSDEQTSSIRSQENNRKLEGNQNLRNKAQNYINKSKSKFINDLVSDLQTSKYSNKEILNQSVDEIINEINNNDGKVSKEKADELFENLYSKLVKTDSDYYEQYKGLKEELKKTRLYVPKNVENDITDFGEFKRKNRGNIVLTNDNNNVNIDSKYKELSETYPELFPSDILNQSDMLQKISEVASDIKKTETNVQAYLDKNMGPDYKMWAREDFDKILDKFQNNVNLAYRYNADNTKKSKFILASNELTDIYKNLPMVQRNYEKVMNSEVLTEKDKVQVDRLLKDEITIDELPKDVNKQGIINVYRAKQPLNIMKEAIQENRKNIRQIRLEQAQNDLGDLSKWKDKKMGLLFSRETASRNIYDVAPKEIAQKIDNNYIQQYHINEAKAIRTINKYTDEIKNLKLSSSKKYNATFNIQELLDGELKDTVQTKKVSEAELVQIFGEGRITLDQLQETGADTQKIINSVESFRKIYDQLFDDVNNVLLKNGLEPVQKRENYFPHFTEAEPDSLLSKAAKLARIDLSGELLPTDIAGKTQNFKPNKKFVGNFLQRNTDITDFNALKGFDRYIQGVTDVIYHTEDIMKFRALSDSIRNFYNTDEIKTKIQNIEESTGLTLEEKSEKINEIREQTKEKSNLSNFITWFDNYINILAGKKSMNDRGMEKELSRKMYKAITKIESRIGANQVAGNIGVSITNIAPLAQASAECSVSNLVKGLYGSMIANGKAIIGKRDTSFASESDFITRRRGTEKTSTSTLDKVTKPLDIITSSIDDVISEGIVRARYIQNLKNGMTQQEALHEADTYSAGLMADRSKGAMPTQFYSTNPLAKMINMFQVEVNNQYSYYFKDMKRNIESASNSKAQMVTKMTKSYAKLLVGSYFLNELISTVRGNATRVLPDPIYLVKELVKGLGNDDEDDDWETLWGTIGEISANLPLSNIIFSLFGESAGFDTDKLGRPSIAGAIPNFNNIGLAMFSEDSDYKKETLKKELEKPLYNLIFPKAGSQVKKTVQGAEALVKGGSYTTSKDGEKKLQFRVDNKDPKEVFKSLLFGKWSTEGAQNYDSNPLTEKQQEELEELGISVDEYKKYRKDLSTINKIESDKNSEGKAISGSASGKKAYAIMNSKEYTKAEKEYLINSLNSEDSKYKVQVEDLNKIGSSEKAYKYFYGLSAENRQEFLDSIDKYNFDVNSLVDTYSTIKNINAEYDKNNNNIKEQGYDKDKQAELVSKNNQRRKSEIANSIINSNFNNEQKLHIYSESYSSNDAEMAKQLNINANAFIQLDSQNFESDKYSNGKTISGSKQAKIVQYVNSLKGLSIPEKAILIKSKSSGYKSYDGQIIQYINNQKLSIKEKEEILDNLGFTIKNGRVY